MIELIGLISLASGLVLWAIVTPYLIRRRRRRAMGLPETVLYDHHPRFVRGKPTERRVYDWASDA